MLAWDVLNEIFISKTPITDKNAEINKIVSFAKIWMPLRQHFGFLKIRLSHCDPGLI